MKCTCKEETKYRSRDGESIKKVVRCVGKRKRLSFSYRVRVYVTETREEKKKNSGTGGKRGKEENRVTKRRKGVRIKLHFNFAAISQRAPRYAKYPVQFTF